MNFMKYLHSDTRYLFKIVGSKVFINVMRGKTEIVPESVLVENSSYRFCNESNSVLVLASTTYSTSHSDDGSYLVFDVIISEATLKAIEVTQYFFLIVKFSDQFLTTFAFVRCIDQTGLFSNDF